MSRIRRTIASTAAGASIIPILVGLPTAPAAAAAWLDSNDITAVNAAWDALEAAEPPIGFTGNVSTCTPGTTSPVARTAALNGLNAFRSLAGVGPATEVEALSTQAQGTALLMGANNQISHEPPSTWACYNDDRLKGARSSNLAWGWNSNSSSYSGSGIQAIRTYMSDEHTPSVGHRRWVICPTKTQFGFGDVTYQHDETYKGTLYPNAAHVASALYPSPTNATFTSRNSTFVAWPYQGLVPVSRAEKLNLLTRGSVQTASGSFTNPTVQITSSNGQAVTATITEFDSPGKATACGPAVTWTTSRKPTAGETWTTTVTGGTTGTISYSTTYVGTPFASAPTPTVSGTAAVGSTLTANAGTWSPSAALTFQWAANGTNIAGATNSTFTPTTAELGKNLTVAVTGTASGYSTTTRTSAATAAVGAGTITGPSSITIVGTAKVGQTVTAGAATWGPAPVTASYTWLVDGVSAGTGTSYPVKAADGGKTLTLRVDLTKPGYTSRSVTSTSLTVGNGEVAVSGQPTIAGSQTVGSTLTVTPASSTPAATTTLTWQRDGQTISGATGSSYTLTPADYQRQITAVVNYVAPGYNPATASVSTGAIGAGAMTPAVPTISGTAAIGQQLSASTGNWAPTGVTFGYQWLANGTAIAGATASTFTIPSSLGGQRISVQVTGNTTGYTAASSTSAQTAVVPLATYTVMPSPVVNGTYQVGNTVSVNPGTWLPEQPTSFSYQWLRNGVAIAGATGASYDLAAADGSTSVSVRVTGNRAGYASASVDSVSTNVALAPLTVPSTISITGAAAGQTATLSDPSAWGPAPVTLTYKWLRNGVQVGTGASLALTTADIGQSLSLQVTGSKSGYASATRISPTVVIGGGTLTVGNPTVSGSATMGSVLTANPAVSSPSTTPTLQWRRDGVAIPGATGATYTSTSADVGADVTVTATYATAGYTTVSRVSAQVRVQGTITIANFPSISGPTKVGSTLSVTTASSSPTITPDLQWRRDNVPITGATGPTYTLTADDLGATINVAATYAAPNYVTRTVLSNTTTAVSTGTINVTQGPSVLGDPKVGNVLTAQPEVSDPPISPILQWHRNGVAIPGATSLTYTLTAEDAGTTIDVGAAYVRAGYTSVYLDGAAVQVPLRPVSVPAAPTIGGEAKVGQTLSVTTATSSPASTPTVQWLRNGVVIPGATARTYTLTPADLGATITVRAGYAAVGYSTTSVTSEPTGGVQAGQLVWQQNSISGFPRVGAELTASVGFAQPGVTTTYQWLADGVAIPGATSTKFTPTSALGGASLTFVAVGTAAGYTAATVQGPTVTVEKASFTTVPTPVIQGYFTAGEVLTVRDDPWGPEQPTSFGYQWYRQGNPIAGATGRSYALTPADVGYDVRVTVTGRRQGYNDRAATSNSTLVEPGWLDYLSNPVISGDPKVGSVLSISQDARFAPTAVISGNQWRRDGQPIGGATSSTYRLTAADLGHEITVSQYADALGYHVIGSNPSNALTAYHPDAAFVQAAYADFLGRAPSTEDLDAALTNFNAGQSRRTLLDQLSVSDEWLTRILTKMYQDTLGRDPDPSGMRTWKPQLASKQLTVAQVAARMYASPEYFKRCNSDNTVWVKDLYLKIMGRPYDTGGLQTWTNYTRTKGHVWVAEQFYQSQESRTKRVKDLYLALLHRPADPSGLKTWPDAIATQGDLALAVSLASSREYALKAEERF